MARVGSDGRRDKVMMAPVRDHEKQWGDDGLTCAEHNATLAGVAIGGSLALALAFSALIACCNEGGQSDSRRTGKRKVPLLLLRRMMRSDWAACDIWPEVPGRSLSSSASS